MKLSFKHKAYLILFGIIVLILAIIYFPRAYRGNLTVTIKDKERVNYEEDGKMLSKYLIYTDQEVFENTDDWFYLKLNSSDLYGQLDKGSTYKVWVTGWRIQIFSTYRNIISIERIPDEEEAG